MGTTTLVLWDIDHTLIESGGVGGKVYAAAFKKVTGRRLEHMAELSGRTEPVIFRETLQLHGIDYPDDLFDRFAEEQARGYAERADELRTRGRALPGAAEALSTMASQDHVIQSVLTGNTRQSAQIKLAVFGLDRYLNLDIGAYGTDSDVRADLVEIARHRAAAGHGVQFDRDSTVLIGDTPNDVKAARDGSLLWPPVKTARTISPTLVPIRYLRTSRTSMPYWQPSTATDHRLSPAAAQRVRRRYYRMSQPSPSANLDEILRQTRHLLLDFDGAVCTLFPHKRAAIVAEDLRATIATQSIQLPESITRTADPFAVLSFAATVSPDLAARVGPSYPTRS